VPWMQGRALVGDAGGRPADGAGTAVAPTADYADDEEREVEERLRALGYLP
jgi:hypothetical protein